MSKEIKFRAFEVKSKLMLDWNCIMQSAFNDIRQNKIEGYYGLLYQIMCDPEYRYRKMLYTGLKDKNGKEIYESDILSQCLPGGVGNLIVFWSKGSFMTRVDYNSSPSSFSNLSDEAYDRMEIIGNIYENPELLKE